MIWVRIARIKIDDLACTAALKPTPWISSFFHEPSVTPLTMLLTRRGSSRAALGLRVSPRADDDFSVLYFQARVWPIPVELAFRPSTSTRCPFASTFHLRRNDNRLFPNSRHKFVSPNVAKHLPPRFFLHAWTPVITPSGVEITATPIPPSTRESPSHPHNGANRVLMRAGPRWSSSCPRT